MIEVEDLHFRYPGSARDAVRGLTFRVGRGEIFGLLGPSGAGKSTTQKILIGLIGGYRGIVHVFGRDLRDRARDHEERIGVSFELPGLYGKLTGRENLAFFAALYRRDTERPDRLLESVGLTADADKRVARYSKGMKMRLGFVRALLNRPELLFLDEPSAGQDPANARRIRGVIAACRAGGATVFLTTHDMTLATEICDRVGFIVDGEIAALDSPRALMLRSGQRIVRVECRGEVGVEQHEFPLDGLGDNQSFAELLRTRRIDAIHTLDATLEDIFVEVTGRRLT